MKILKRLFGNEKTQIEKEFTQEEFEKDYELKTEGLENVLGKMHNLVGHAIISFAVGGAVDMYYFLNHIKGTGFATMELLDPHGNGPMKNRIGTYELVVFGLEKNSKSVIENTTCYFACNCIKVKWTMLDRTEVMHYLKY